MTQFSQIAAQSVHAIRHADRARLEAEARAAGEQVIVLDLGACRDKQQMLDAIARGLAFPEWFGANLDALYDSLSDLSADDGRGFAIFLDQVPVAGDFNSATREAMLETFRDAAEFHAQTRLPFRVLYTLA